VIVSTGQSVDMNQVLCGVNLQALAIQVIAFGNLPLPGFYLGLELNCAP